MMPCCTSIAARALSNSSCETNFESRSEEHTSELQSQSNLVCRLLLEKKKSCTPNLAHYWRHAVTSALPSSSAVGCWPGARIMGRFLSRPRHCAYLRGEVERLCGAIY